MANSLIPYSFVPGTKAMANEVNANFIALANSVEAGKQYTSEAIENFNTQLEARLEEYDGLVGEKMQPDMSNSVNISNCILGQPQRIKYTFSSGVLTIQAGTRVIIPYGVEDLRKTYPVGSSFLTENMKVVDSQFASKGFFVWIELQSDLVLNNAGVSGQKSLFLDIDNYSLKAILNSNCSSGTSASTTQVWYDTTSNIVKFSNANNSTWGGKFSFPLLEGEFVLDTGFSEITNVFNCTGFIGHTFWLDKGVKALMPDGLNSDGTYKNIEYVSKSLYLFTFDNTSVWTRSKQALVFSPSGLIHAVYNDRYYETYTNPDSKGRNTVWLNLSNNVMYLADSTAGEYSKITACFLGYLSANKGQITSFSPRPAFKIADLSEVQRLIRSYNTTSKGTTGYFKSGDGIIIQWGINANGVVTFPIPFSSDASYMVTLGTEAPKGSHYGCTINGRTATTFTLEGNYSYITGWIAVGY